jgi:hypothetical protein
MALASLATPSHIFAALMATVPRHQLTSILQIGLRAFFCGPSSTHGQVTVLRFTPSHPINRHPWTDADTLDADQ